MADSLSSIGSLDMYQATHPGAAATDYFNDLAQARAERAATIRVTPDTLHTMGSDAIQAALAGVSIDLPAVATEPAAVEQVTLSA